MGNIEKLVVLTILFLSVIVLAISFSEKGDPGGESATPLTAAQARAGAFEAPDQPDAPDLVGDDGSSPLTPRAGLLSTEKVDPDLGAAAAPPAQDAPEPDLPERRADGKQILLRTRAGLVATQMEDYMIYRVEDGDTWASISDTYYGRNLVSQLQAANEGLERLVAGERILVPIVDLTVGAGDRAPFVPGPAPGFQQPGAAPAAALPGGAARTYEVANGDNLSRISERLWGTQKHWRELFEANRHQMASEDELDLGMVLIVPVLAEDD